MGVLTVLRAVHIAAGTTALSSFWIPLVAAKGGRLHRRAGWVYVAAMAVVAATALVICGYRLTFDHDRGRRIAATFLLYISVLSAASSSAGMRALRDKGRTGPRTHPWDIGIAVLLLLAALGTALYGLRIGVTLLVAFSPVGLLVGGGQLLYWLRPPRTRMEWFFEHLSSMIGSSVGALTAFLVVNAPKLGLVTTSLVLWIVPSLAGVLAIVLWSRYYRRRFAGRAPIEARAA